MNVANALDGVVETFHVIVVHEVKNGAACDGGALKVLVSHDAHVGQRVLSRRIEVLLELLNARYPPKTARLAALVLGLRLRLVLVPFFVVPAVRQKVDEKIDIVGNLLVRVWKLLWILMCIFST